MRGLCCDQNLELYSLMYLEPVVFLKGWRGLGGGAAEFQMCCCLLMSLVDVLQKRRGGFSDGRRQFFVMCLTRRSKERFG